MDRQAVDRLVLVGTIAGGVQGLCYLYDES